MPGRVYSSDTYRYGFNNQQKDDEITGKIGTHTTALFWEYDSRLGWRWNVDPKYKYYISNYTVLGGNPILNLDPNGDDYYQNQITGKVEEHQRGWRNSLSDVEKRNWTHIGIYKATDWKGNPYYNDFSRFYTLARLAEIDEGLSGASDPGNGGLTKSQVKVVKAGVIVVGGVAVMVASCGSAAPVSMVLGIISGSLATSGGTMKLLLAIKDDPKSQEAYEKMPTGIVDAYIGLTIEAMVKDQKVQKKIRLTTQIVDGAIDVKGLVSKVESLSDYVDKSIAIINISIESIEKIEDCNNIDNEAPLKKN